MKKIIFAALAVVMGLSSFAQTRTKTSDFYKVVFDGASTAPLATSLPGTNTTNNAYTITASGTSMHIVGKSTGSKGSYGDMIVMAITSGATNSTVDLTNTNAQTMSIKIKSNGTYTPALTIQLQDAAAPSRTADGLSALSPALSSSYQTYTIPLTGATALTEQYGSNNGALDKTQMAYFLFSFDHALSLNGATLANFDVEIEFVEIGNIPPTIELVSSATTLTSASNFAVGSTVTGTASATKTITINNTGNSALNLTGTTAVTLSGGDAADFVITQPTTPVAAAGTTSFTVGLASTAAAGAKSTTLTIVSNDPLVPSFTLNLVGNVTAALAPVIGLASGVTPIASATTFAVGTTTVGTASATKTIIIGNVGTAALNLTGIPKIALSNTDFVVTQATSPIAVGSTSTFTVAVSSTATAGAKTATLTIASDDPATPSYTVNLTGTVNAPTIGLVSGATAIASASTFDIGTTVTGTASAAKTITINNTGLGALNLSGTPKIVISGANLADFVVTQSAVVSPVAASTGTTSFTVNLSASAAASATAKTATLTIASNDPAIPSYTVTLTGTVNFATAISEALSKNTVISPNPFTDNINVKLNSAISGDVDATVRNAYGVAVTQVSNVPAAEFNVPAANLAPGIYILEVTTNDGTTAIKRIVKQ